MGYGRCTFSKQHSSQSPWVAFWLNAVASAIEVLLDKPTQLTLRSQSQRADDFLYRYQPCSSVRRTYDCVNAPAFLAFQQLVFERLAHNAFETIRIAARAAVFVCDNHVDNTSEALRTECSSGSSRGPHGMK